ncbi:hypothetical protein HYH02_015366 [Chlamydomonas schloesseri]|uniref:Uncharacterized protein n=1 Tax=Chlamydomonas schloesseri TaxID=2026947 RepID=A0A835SCY6_9CHLO|nr:hypothetical protein HYH02_015443 [Chlamydomonas schloesseri]KAG2423122.1 hypothetical protein HYH02_015366 [Chlamydomonas schloesseri]|eukprot:KAG2422417.1 hypothetical protein HYH02_015443 [Chlamydomonas schloesseri]
MAKHAPRADVYAISYESIHEKRLLHAGEYWELETTSPAPFCITMTALPRQLPPGLIMQLERTPFWRQNRVNGKLYPTTEAILEMALSTVQGRFQKIHKIMCEKAEEYCKLNNTKYDTSDVSRFLLADADGNVDDACKIAVNQLKYYFFTRSSSDKQFRPLASLLRTSNSNGPSSAAFTIGDLAVAPADDITRAVVTAAMRPNVFVAKYSNKPKALTLGTDTMDAYLPPASGLCRQLEHLSGDCIVNNDGPNYAHPEAPIHILVAVATNPVNGDVLARTEQQLSPASLPDKPGKQHPLRATFDKLQLEAWYNMAFSRTNNIIQKAGPAAMAMDIDEEEEGAA